MKCRFCNNDINNVLIDLGMSPLANSYLSKDDLTSKESFYPLCAYVCSHCFLIQLDEIVKPEEIFSSYSYFSSFSDTWLSHTKNFVSKVISQFSLDKNKMIIEIASNDGYLLKNFINEGIPCLGIEPAENIAKTAQQNSVPTLNKFFSEKVAKDLVEENYKADLLISFNVLPHVPNLVDFIKGLKILLKPNGILVLQFSAYVLPFIQNTEFDTIYHEHFSFFSLFTLKKILESYHLQIFNVEELDIHGGSLRVYVVHSSNTNFPISSNVKNQLDKEQSFGLMNLKSFESFSTKVNMIRFEIWKLLIKIKEENKKIVCYGAAAKGNTLLNFCGIDKNNIEYVVDRSIHKQGKFLPGTHIPIYAPNKIFETKPDYVLILAWNLKNEIVEQINGIQKWGGKFIVLFPKIEIF